MGSHPQFGLELLEPRVLLSGVDPSVALEADASSGGTGTLAALEAEEQSDVWAAFTSTSVDESMGAFQGLSAQSLPAAELFDAEQYPKETIGPNPTDGAGAAGRSGRGTLSALNGGGSGLFQSPAPAQPTPTTYQSTDVPKAIMALTTSTITVPGSLKVTDVNVQLDITHGRDSDLKVTLVGPTGVRVELFNAVGGNGQNFTGTIINDEAASPIGLSAAPFTGSFFGSGFLGNFDGLAGNGTWTLELVDLVGADEQGVLNSWSLALTADPAEKLHTLPYGVSTGVGWLSLQDVIGTPGAEKVYAIDLVAGQRLSASVQTPAGGAGRFGNFTALPITDDNSPVVSTISVPDTLTLQDLDVLVAIDHPNAADLDVTLISPNGTRIPLSSDNGQGGKGYFYTIFDDQAALAVTDAAAAAPYGGRYRPETALSALNGSSATGDWHLEIIDDTAGPGGAAQLVGWEVQFNASLDAALRIFGPTGQVALNQAAATKAPDPAVAGLVVPVTGTYFLQVVGSGQSAGSYTLEAGVFDASVPSDAGTTTDLSAARAAAGGNAFILGTGLGVGQTKLFTTSFTAGESVVVAVGTPGGFYRPRVSVLGPSNLVLGDTDSGPGKDSYLRFTVPTTGNYALAVDYPDTEEFRDAVSTGTFLLSLVIVDNAGNNTRAGARPISDFGYHDFIEAVHGSGAVGSLGEWDGNIAAAGDDDFFALGQLPAGEYIQVDVARRSTSAVFAALQLVDSTGQVLVSTEPSRSGGNEGSTQLAVRIETAGQYFLRLQGAATQQGGGTPSTGEYRLSYARFGVLNLIPTGVSFTNTVTALPESTSTADRIRVADIVVADDGVGANTLRVIGPGAANFAIVGSSLYLRAGVVLDFETQPTLPVTVGVDDPSVGGDPDASALFTLTIQDANDPPVVSLANTVTSLPQDTSTATRIRVADIVLADDALGTVVLALTGPDAVLFRVVGNQILLRAGVVLSATSNPVLDVTVSADDPSLGTGPESSVALAIAITAANLPPSLSLSNLLASVPENTLTATRVKLADLVIADDGQGSNQLTLTGPDVAAFEILGTELFLKAGTVLNFETKSAYSFSVTVDDPAVGSSPDDTEAVSLAVSDVNEPPTAVLLSNVVASLAFDTDTSRRIRVADISVTDDALGTNVLTLTGPDVSFFRIVGNQVLLRAGVVLDPFANPVLDVTVNVDDASVGATPDATVALSITITRPNQPPSLSVANLTSSLPESISTSTRLKLADLVITDDGLGTNALSLSGVDAALFELDGTQLFLKAGTLLNFETKPSLAVTVAVDDAAVGSSPDDTESIAIAITDVNEAPTSVILSNLVSVLPHDTDTSRRLRVADIAVSDDALGTNLLSLSGADAVLFRIVGNQVLLRAGVVLDPIGNPVLDVTVNVDDAGVGASPDAFAALSITVLRPNLPPTLSVANLVTSLPESISTAARIKLADLVINDDGLGTNVLSLTGADAALLEIDAGQLFLKAGAALDFETNPQLDVSISLDDAAVGSTPDDTEPVSVAITDANEPPSAVLLSNVVASLPENTSTSSRIRVADIAITDDALGTNSLSLSGPDAVLFRIVGNQLLLRAGVVLNAASNPSLDVTIHVDDAAVGGAPDASQSFAIAITAPNLPPAVALANATTTISEGQSTAAPIKVADLVVTDDGQGTNLLSLAGADAGLFEIVGQELFLKAGAVLDFETNAMLDVTVAVDDASIGATPDDTENLQIAVTDANDVPSAVALANAVTSLPQTTDTSRRLHVADVVVTDDALGTNTLALAGPDANLFRIVGTEVLLRAGVVLDATNHPVLSAFVTVDDASLGATPDASTPLSIQIT